MRPFIKKAKPPGLMLTPLLDMFTIILIFLIVSFSAEDYDFKLDEHVKLPESSARSQFKPSINMSIGKTGITVEQEPVVELPDGKLPEEYYLAGEIPKLVSHLGKYFDDLVKAGAIKLAKPGDGNETDPGDVDDGGGGPDENTGDFGADEIVITIQADKDLDYKTLYLVLRSAAKAGFFKYRLAVFRK